MRPSFLFFLDVISDFSPSTGQLVLMLLHHQYIASTWKDIGLLPSSSILLLLSISLNSLMLFPTPLQAQASANVPFPLEHSKYLGRYQSICALQTSFFLDHLRTDVEQIKFCIYIQSVNFEKCQNAFSYYRMSFRCF